VKVWTSALLHTDASGRLGALYVDLTPADCVALDRISDYSEHPEDRYLSFGLLLSALLTDAIARGHHAITLDREVAAGRIEVGRANG